MSKEQNEVLEQQRYLLERRMYRLDPAPPKLYFQAVLYDALHRAYDNLTYREQRTVAKHLGFCDTCWSTKKAVLINGEIEYRPIKPMTFKEISHSASRRSDKASERTYKNALEKMRKALCVK